MKISYFCARSSGFAGGARQYGGAEISRADMLFAAGEVDYSVDRSVMDSVMGSHAGDFVEGSRLEGWKKRVAELKLDLEQRQALEGKLRFELREKGALVKELQDRLASAMQVDIQKVSSLLDSLCKMTIELTFAKTAMGLPRLCSACKTSPKSTTSSGTHSHTSLRC